MAKRVQTILQPLNKQSFQCYLGTGLHTLGLLGWILEQTGRADVYVSTFSTSDAFLSGFYRLKKRGMIGNSVLVADLKASNKTMKLYRLMQKCFDTVYLSMNHSKIVLVQNDKYTISVITSQNQTYGDRAECTMVTTDQRIFLDLFTGLQNIVNHDSIQLNGLFNRLTERDRERSKRDDESEGDICPFGY
ncbi:MAG: C4-dicarboxylate ABC transporter [Prevotella sp.]|nr:C4-dicarboxylate ABC transporter [Prevotella sp.]